MRTLGRIVLFLLIILPAMVLAHRIWDALHWNELAAMLSGRIENARPSSCYLAVDGQWMAFRLSGLGKALRVRSNGVIAADVVQSDDREWWYAFEYQLLDDRARTLRQGVYHHRTRVTRMQDGGKDAPTSRGFLLDPERYPSDGRTMVLYFGGEESPASVRIRPLQKDPELEALMFRVYEEVPNPGHQLGYLWQRLAESKKARLARSSIYGPDLLLKEEKKNLLRYEWKAVGPLGVEDDQYRLMKLYIAREQHGTEVHDELIPYGLYSDALLRGMIPIPEGAWRITLETVRLGAEDPSTQDVRVRWYGRGISQRWQTRMPFTSGRHLLQETVQGGLLEVVAPGPMVVRVWGSQGGAPIELTPEPARIRAYVTDSDGSLSVGLDHLVGYPTPFRIDIRARLGAGQTAVARSLTYELLDRTGGVLRQGQLPGQFFLTNYDRLVNTDSGANMSEPVRYYFDLAPEVASIRFSSRQELLLTAYTRPPTLVRAVRVPEDYQSTLDDGERQAAWFLRRPEEEERLRREFRSEMLIVQQRPPEDDPRLLEGDYDWQLYQPNGNWRARYLLIPRKGQIPVRDQSLAAVYRELSPGRPLALRFRGLPGHQDIRPTLLYLRPGSSPLDIRVMLDDRLHSDTQIAGKQGELKLPTVRPGNGRLAVTSSEPVRWFINQADADTPAYLRRLAMYLNGQGLEFDFVKEQEESEVLSGELYTRESGRCRLRVTVTGEVKGHARPRQEWTFRSRLFDLRQETDEPIPVLNSGLAPLHGGQRFVLPLGSDLPPGRYRIRFTLEDAPEGYLTLYRLNPGQPALRTFFQEPVYAQSTDN